MTTFKYKLDMTDKCVKIGTGVLAYVIGIYQLHELNNNLRKPAILGPSVTKTFNSTEDNELITIHNNDFVRWFIKSQEVTDTTTGLKYDHYAGLLDAAEQSGRIPKATRDKIGSIAVSGERGQLLHPDTKLETCYIRDKEVLNLKERCEVLRVLLDTTLVIKATDEYGNGIGNSDNHENTQEQKQSILKSSKCL
ncbi:MAG: hypothetical protein ACTSUE_23490 [Promethearchaeota archaeon]